MGLRMADFLIWKQIGSFMKGAAAAGKRHIIQKMVTMVTGRKKALGLCCYI